MKRIFKNVLLQEVKKVRDFESDYILSLMLKNFPLKSIKAFSNKGLVFSIAWRGGKVSCIDFASRLNNAILCNEAFKGFPPF